MEWPFYHILRASEGDKVDRPVAGIADLWKVRGSSIGNEAEMEMTIV